MDAASFITKLGGSTQIARDLGIPMTTVAAWRQRNVIPRWRVERLVQLAISKKVPIPDEIIAGDPK